MFTASQGINIPQTSRKYPVNVLQITQIYQAPHDLQLNSSDKQGACIHI